MTTAPPGDPVDLSDARRSSVEESELPGRADRDGGPLDRLADFAAHVAALAEGCIVFVDGPASRVVASTRPDPASRESFLVALDERVVDSRQPVVVEDLSEKDDAALTGEAFGAYLGVPLIDQQGQLLGALSVNDPAPRLLRERHVRLLGDLAKIICDQLELTRRAEAMDDDHEAGAELARAIAEGQIVPWYQPLIHLGTGKIIGVEALSRRQLPGGGVLGPHTFIPLAEESDLIVDLDMAVIEQALDDLCRFQDVMPTLRMSVNLSGRHLDHDDWAETIRRATDAAGVRADTVDLELTETARPTDLAAGRVMLERVRDLGFTIWFDDFGTGWSALQDLLRLPVDGIKIDRAFAARLGSQHDDAIVRALISAASELRLKVTIEGIETAEQARLAREYGCDHAQGWYWAPAVTADELDAALRAVGDAPWPSAAGDRTGA